MATVDIKVVGTDYSPEFEPHQRRFDVLDDVVLCSSSHGIVEQFLVPDLSCEALTVDVAKKMAFYDGESVVGNGEIVCTGAREKLDGFESVAFGIQTNTGVYYYMWDNESLYPIESTQPFLSEKIDGVYHILSKVETAFNTSVKTSFHSWTYLSIDLLNKSKEGVVVRANEQDFKVVREPTHTLKVVQGVSYDSTNKEIEKGLKLDDGLYDFNEFGQMKRERLDRVYPDSLQQIQIQKRCLLRYEQMYSLVSLPKYSVGPAAYFSYARKSEANMAQISDRALLYNIYNKIISTPQFSKKKIKDKKDYIARREIYEEFFLTRFKDATICGAYEITPQMRTGEFEWQVVKDGIFLKNSYAYRLKMFKKYPSVNPVGKVILSISKKRRLGSSQYRGFFFRFLFMEGNIVKVAYAQDFAPSIESYNYCDMWKDRKVLVDGVWRSIHDYKNLKDPLGNFDGLKEVVSFVESNDLKQAKELAGELLVNIIKCYEKLEEVKL